MTSGAVLASLTSITSGDGGDDGDDASSNRVKAFAFCAPPGVLDGDYPGAVTVAILNLHDNQAAEVTLSVDGGSGAVAGSGRMDFAVTATGLDANELMVNGVAVGVDPATGRLPSGWLQGVWVPYSAGAPALVVPPLSFTFTVVDAAATVACTEAAAP